MGTGNDNWKVVIEERGRAGSIRYMEGPNEVRFDWEFGGGSSVVFIWGPREAGWDDKYPWAVGRRHQVYERVGESVIAQKAPSCKVKLDLAAGTIDLYKP